ncbi:patatin-like phospholipase family protein [Virgibacillus sp. C22-A2]|uniref:Patatin-like phospholipase family protein n=1 Tax=Virgibacillus tibetensis TaxID=3042313 RepID=A0ABU6KB51_9BACI|nr:patatin-like phospholipase family protein [Virgibacillus sp. C22-A2]
MKIDGVFSGGGVKSFAFIGALKSIEENSLQLERVAGTSAGAIVASFIAADYRHDEISNMLTELDLKYFLDPPRLTTWIPFSKWFFLYFQLGINKGERLENWLYQQLAKKNIFTFNDLKEGYLKVVVSDLSLGKLVVISDDLQRIYGLDPGNFSIAKAVRMSAGFPYFFMPKKLAGRGNDKSVIVDGGLLSNFPLWIFENRGTKNNRPILGVKLSTTVEEKSQPRQIRNAFDMFHALFSTMKQAHDARYISTSQKNNIIFIPIEEDMGTTDFYISNEKKEQLISAGTNSADLFLKHWPK